jgi:hypothetical protein
MRTLERIGFALLLLAGALVVAGEYLDLPWMFRAALVSVGLMACVGGMRTIRKGEVGGGFFEANYRERLTGASAGLMGIILLLGGAIIVGLGVVDLYSRGQAGSIVTDLVLRSPRGLAIPLALAGLMIAAFGVTRILSGSARAAGSFAPHVELGFRAAGIASTFIGLAMLALAAGLMVAPELMTGLFRRALAAAKSAISD